MRCWRYTIFFLYMINFKRKFLSYNLRATFFFLLAVLFFSPQSQLVYAFVKTLTEVYICTFSLLIIVGQQIVLECKKGHFITFLFVSQVFNRCKQYTVISMQNNKVILKNICLLRPKMRPRLYFDIHKGIHKWVFFI